MAANIKLRAFEQEDIKDLHKWLNDDEAISMVGHTYMNIEEVIKKVSKMQSNGDSIMVIEDKDKNLVGWIYLTNISFEHGRAEIGLVLSPEHRGHGYGRVAMEEMIKIGFNQLRLNKIYLTTRGINKRAIALYEKVGFVLEGTLRQQSFVNGEYHDNYFMGILAKEWNKR